MLQHKAFKFRIYPNHEQIVQLHKTLGCSRFVCNHLLERWNLTYQTTGKGLSYNACATQLPAMKREWPWLKEVDNPRYTLQYERKLAKWQRILTRRKQGGSNWHKAKRKVAQIYERIRNSRLEAMHQQTTKWIRENQTICTLGFAHHPFDEESTSSQTHCRCRLG